MPWALIRPLRGYADLPNLVLLRIFQWSFSLIWGPHGSTVCIFDYWRSIFRFLGLSWSTFRGLNFVPMISPQISGHLYLLSKIFNWFEETFFPQHFVAVCYLVQDFVADGIITAVGALRALIDFTLSNARRFYSWMGNPLAAKGLKLLAIFF